MRTTNVLAHGQVVARYPNRVRLFDIRWDTDDDGDAKTLGLPSEVFVRLMVEPSTRP